MDKGGNKVEAVDSQQIFAEKISSQISFTEIQIDSITHSNLPFPDKISDFFFFFFFFFIYQKVIESGKYNFEACRIPLKTNLNVEFFRFMLSYYGKAVVEFLEFGFPIGFSGKVQKRPSRVKKHKWVTAYPAEVKKYLRKEGSYGAVLGPFRIVPFSGEFCISPLNTVSKNDSAERRVFVCVEVLWPSQPKGVMSSVVSLPNYTFTGQA